MTFQKACNDITNSFSNHLVDDVEPFFRTASEFIYGVISDENKYQHVRSRIDPSSLAKMKATVSSIEKAFEKYKPEELMVAFNGGKDCTILLYLVHAVAQHIYLKQHSNSLEGFHAPNILYIRSRDPFPEMEQFFEEVLDHYHVQRSDPAQLNVVEGSIRQALTDLLQHSHHLKAVFMGTRNTDPNATNLELFAPTDSGWPALMRVNPILEWTNRDVWQLIRGLRLPYCRLYDMGYTSIGNKADTKPNPVLQSTDPDGRVKYRPAYEMTEESMERRGRNM